jgi:undecaprenyl diphosphate synthase
MSFSPNDVARRTSLITPHSASRLHVAIIMDGSGRWARARGLPRPAGHRAGMEAVRRTVPAAHELGLGTLTLHAFSSDNWQRPAREVATLMQIFEDYLRADTELFIERGIELRVVGRRDRLAPGLRETIECAERATARGREMLLRLAIDYSARAAILRAAQHLDRVRDLTLDDFARLLEGAEHPGTRAADVDLLIRTGGEQRLSDFHLWECAYAELYFTPRMWPDFSRQDLEAALREFHSRDRRFGRIVESSAV